jgi:SAM-dependent methyltransferase
MSKVLAIDIIEHVPDDQAVIAEISRVLKPGGRLVLTTLIESRPHHIYPMSFPDHVREYTPDQLALLVRESGLAVDDMFFFYYAPRLLAREIQLLSRQSRLGRTLLSRVAIGMLTRVIGDLGMLTRVIGDLERLHRWGQPGGVGVLALKS